MKTTMASRTISRRLTIGASPARSFHSSRRAFIKVGDRLPQLPDVLQENSPGNKVDLAKELANGKGLIIGIPAAFSPSCSASHIPGYISHPKLSSGGKAFVLAVNDAFVTKAWASSLDPENKSGLRFLADPSATYTTALDVAFENKPIFGGIRSKRYAIETEDGVVKAVHVEPDNTGVDISSAKKVLG